MRYRNCMLYHLPKSLNIFCGNDFRYLSTKFQEMEEKMQREKNKNRVKTNEENEPQVETSMKMGSVPSISDDPNAPLIDEDGQSHNIDNAEQTNSTIPLGENRQYEFLTTISPSDIDTEITMLMNDDRIGQTTPPPTLPPLPSQKSLFEIESEKVKVIEIKSDGSSGHLSPLQLHDR